MTKLSSRLDRLEALRPDAPSDNRHVIIRSMIRPGVDEPVSAFAYVLASMDQVRMEEGESFEEFRARLENSDGTEAPKDAAEAIAEQGEPQDR